MPLAQSDMRISLPQLQSKRNSLEACNQRALLAAWRGGRQRWICRQHCNGHPPPVPVTINIIFVIICLIRAIIIMTVQQIPSCHLSTWWKYVITMLGGKVTLLYSRL